MVAEACRRIEAAEEVPTLEQLAGAAKLSPFHFHRLFRRVAGVTPRAYAAERRARRLQERLQSGGSVTAALYDAGFNSAGRFYAAADAMLGMRPGAYRAGGANESICYAMGQSSIGAVAVAATRRGVCAILLGEDASALLADLRSRFARSDLHEAGPDFAGWVAQVVALIDSPGRPDGLGLPLDIQGTAFQRRVWEALRAIPPGETASYSRVAERLGNPRAARAVAGACAANPVAVAVPCHRVVAADGAIGGYRWGSGRKEALLAREKQKFTQNPDQHVPLISFEP